MANPEKVTAEKKKPSILVNRELRNKITRERWEGILRPIVTMGINDKSEIEYAVVIITGEELPESQIAPTLTWARKNGYFLHPNKNPNTAIQKETLTEEESKNRVIRVVVRNMLVNVPGEPEEIEGRIDKSLHILKRLLDRGALIGDAVQIAKLDGREAESPVVRFAQEVVEAGMIGEDLSNHHDLSGIFKQKNTKLLPFAYRIILEAFISAKKEALRREDTKLLRYIQLRDSLFPDGGKSKEASVLVKLESVLDGLEMGNEYVDDLGYYYKLDRNGNRSRTPIDGELDHPDLRVRRGLSRLRGEFGESKGRIGLWDLENPLDEKKY